MNLCVGSVARLAASEHTVWTVAETIRKVYIDTAHIDPVHTDPAHTDTVHIDTVHTDPAHIDTTHTA